MLGEQGVSAAICTPHMLASEENADARLKETAKAFSELCELAEGRGLPELFLGYEVAYFPEMSKFDGIRRLTLGGTDRLLIELPVAPITDRMIDDIFETACVNRVMPVFAHIERYLDEQGFYKLLELIESGNAQAQITAAVFQKRSFNRKIFSLIEDGYISFLGSDCHSVSKRPPKWDEFIAVSDKKHGNGFMNYIRGNCSSLYSELKAAKAAAETLK